ncbi:MAG: hypothetical protein QW666_03340 [Candidatus Woesearchaeota archaeon]
MDRLEAIILIVVILAAVIGLYYIYAGTGEAIRMLPGCEGGYTLRLTTVGLKPTLSDEYHFRGLTGTVELIGIKGDKAKLVIDGVETPYLGFQQVWFGDKVAVKMSEVKPSSVSFCLASNVATCTEYVWNYETKRRECKSWTSQADVLYK